MHSMRILLGAVLAVAFLANSALAHEYHRGSLVIGHPWTRATPPGAVTAGAYLTVTNRGTSPERLLGATSPAGKVELHAVDMSDGVMKMRPVPEGLEIPAGATVELAPAGYHLMIVGLTAPIVRDDRVPLTLIFEKAGEIAVELAAGPAGAPAGHGAH